MFSVHTKGHCYLVSGTGDNPSLPERLYVKTKALYAELKLTLDDYSWLSSNNQMYRYPSFFEFSSAMIRSPLVLPSKFSLLWYEFLLSIRNLGITWPLPRRELSRLDEPKRLYKEKLSLSPGLITLPGEVRQLPHPSCLGPRGGLAILINVNGWLILQGSKLKLSSARETRGESCSGYSRPKMRPKTQGHRFQIPSV